MNNSISFIEERKVGSRILPVLFVVTKLEVLDGKILDLKFFSHFMKYHDYYIIKTLGLPIIEQKDTVDPGRNIEDLEELQQWHELVSGVNVIRYLKILKFI